MIFERILGIAACDPRGVIGKNGKLPWHCPEDLKHFSDTILGFPIVMGYRTFLSLPVPYFKERKTIVFTRQQFGANKYVCRAREGCANLGSNGPSKIDSNEEDYPQTGKADKEDKLGESRQNSRSLPERGIHFVSSLTEFFALKESFKDLYVIGGAQIYSLFFKKNLIAEFILTRFESLYEGDTFFPLSLLAGWTSLKILETPVFSIHRYTKPGKSFYIKRDKN